MIKMFDREVERIRKDFREVCRTFLDVYAAASASDVAWETEENHTDQLLWRRIGQLERQLEAVAPGTGPRYDRTEPLDESLRNLADWCGLETELPAPAAQDSMEYADNCD